MRLFRLFGAATAFSVLAMPALAQAVIYEPGYCAQYYPDANCQNMGPGNPNSPEYRSRLGQSDRTWSGGQTVGVAGKRSRIHRSASSAVRTQ
ncbi:hypothetical protein SAMN05443247_07394 [Bradyrhizobium erythrophlei]|jgi:hypothetical protein|nr:hypothetical protein SAMN05443247_07394 [Bradyrhizobium erythrophlei]